MPGEAGILGASLEGLRSSAVTTIAECIASRVLFQPLLNWSGVTNISYVPWAGSLRQTKHLGYKSGDWSPDSQYKHDTQCRLLHLRWAMHSHVSTGDRG